MNTTNNKNIENSNFNSKNQVIMRFKLLTFLLMLFIIFSCQKKDEVVKRENEPDVHILEGEDTEMNNAIENAQKSLYQFKNAIKSENPNYYNFALKERFNTNEGGEHIWISEIQYIDDDFWNCRRQTYFNKRS